VGKRELPKNGAKNGFLPHKIPGGYSLPIPLSKFTFGSSEMDFQGVKINFPGYYMVGAARQDFWGENLAG
jgi:hypothetical protein